jgi:hypothetical protein
MRVGVEVEGRAHAADHQRQHAAQRIAHAQQQLARASSNSTCSQPSCGLPPDSSASVRASRVA